MYDIIIVGGGPAGLTAALYALRAGKTVLIIEKNTFGGQITWSPRVENFPTIPSISGTELADRLLAQVLFQGADTELDEVISAEKDGDVFRVRTEFDGEFYSRALIIAAGARPMPLGIDREEELTGNGVCYCAVCDGAFYKGREVAVVGGGNSALQDALLLSETCRAVHIIHRRASFKGEARLVEALRKKDNVTFDMLCAVTELHGETELTGVSVVYKEGSEGFIAVDGLFVAAGHAPELGVFSKLIGLDGRGCADSGEDCLTKTPGVFVAGDCRRKTVRQLTTAVGDGATAALAACSYLDRISE